MKLNYSRTLKVGIAFFIIMVFWEVYDFAIPLLLDRTYGMNASERGLIMGLDNLLSLFLLPIFGALSDKMINKKCGRRTPFIVIGTICAVVFLVIMAVVENAELKKLLELGIKDPNILVEKGYLDSKWLAPDFLNAVKDTEQYFQYNKALGTAQSAMARAFSKAHPTSIVIFIAILLILLVSMATFRSPAVALMPDVTVKPLRSQANAVINFMGGAGGFVSIILYTFLAPTYGSYLTLFVLLAFVMLICLLAYLSIVREHKFVLDRFEEERKWNIVDAEEESGSAKLSKTKLISFILILASIFFWFMGYNAVKSHLSVYATSHLGYLPSEVGYINIINGIGAAIGLFPVVLLATKLGRKKTIFIGLVVAILAFIPAIYLTNQTRLMLGVYYVIAGFGLVIINVNTFPMVTELSVGSNVGKFTGYYYVAAMSAQAITPFFSGLFMDKFGQNTVFIYSVVMIIISAIIMLFVKHGDSKPTKEQVKEGMAD